MFSASSLARLAELHPVSQKRFIALDGLLPSLSIQIVQGYRTYAYQDSLWNQGRTTPGPPCTHAGVVRPIGTCPQHPLGLTVTDAKGGYSGHNFAYPADLCPFDIMPGQPDWDLNHAAWKRMLAAGLTVGLAEGALWRTFPDNPHFYPQELPAEPTDAMRAQYADGGLPEVWRNFPTMVSATVR